MKAVAHRSRDLGDVESLVETNSKLDAARIVRWVDDIASALEMPELLSDLEAILQPETLLRLALPCRRKYRSRLRPKRKETDDGPLQPGAVPKPFALYGGRSPESRDISKRDMLPSPKVTPDV